MLYSLDEICLIPKAKTNISHRSDINIMYGDKLPLFISPMGNIIDANNMYIFNNLGFNVIIPRTVHWDIRLSRLKEGHWIAVGLRESELLFDLMSKGNIGMYNTVMKVCIDQANGHMEDLLNICGKYKNEFGDKVLIMAGNIANPQAYVEYAKVGIDYIRLGIGTGNICTTSVQTGVHYPMGSLILDTNKVRNSIVEKRGDDQWEYKLPKIVADGGFKSIDQVIKALALGADYVMLGEMIAKSEEACGNVIYDNNTNTRLREYYGMSTEKAQYLINNSSAFRDSNFTPKHTEGIRKYLPIEYSINDWLKDFTHALRSSMSYLNINNINCLPGQVKWDTISIHSSNNYKDGKQ